MIELAGLLEAVLIGWLLVKLLGPVRGLRPRWAAALCEVALGAGAGTAVTAAAFFLMLWVGGANRWMVFAYEGAALAVLAVLGWRRRRGPAVDAEAVPSRPPSWRWNWLLAVALALGMLLVGAAQVNTARLSPYGEFDAFAMWNVRAKFLLGPGQTWKRAFSPLLVRQRPDHPLLLSSFIARTWRLGGDAASPAAPFGTSILYFAAVMVLLASSLALVRGPSSAMLACLLMIANTSFLRQSTWEYADIPVSLYFLGTFVLLLLSAEAAGRRRTVTLAMSGAFASLAAMTKNEGIPFLLIVFAGYLAICWRQEGIAAAWSAGRVWLAGALPGALLQAAFKLFLAPHGGPFAGPTVSQAIDFLRQPDRYATVAAYLVRKAGEAGSGISHPLVLIVIIGLALGFETSRRLRPYALLAAITLAGMLLAYCGVYLTTPDNLEWRLDTSLGRLYSQLWPLFLLFLFLVLRAPRDPAEAIESAAKKTREGKRKKKARRRST